MVENQVSFRHVPHVEKGHNHVSTRAPGVVALSQLRHLSLFGKFSSLLTVKTLTGMTTDAYPRENCIAPAIVLIVWTTNTKK